jgi:hypothetical protein
MAMYESAWQKLIPITRIELVAVLSCCADEDLHRLSQWAAEGWQVLEVRRMCVNGLSVVAGALCGWMVAS